MRHTILCLGIAVATALGVSSCGDDGGKHTDALVDTTSNGAALHVDTLTGHFGSVMTGTTSAAMTFTVSNTGMTASGAIAPTLTGGDAGDFAVQSGCAALAPAGTCQVTVTFTPSSAGAKAATLNLAATPGGMASVALDGTGVAGGALSISASANALGGVVIGQTGATIATFTVTNTSTAATGAVSIAATGSDPGEFPTSADTCSGQTLPAGGTCTFVASFAPHSRGPKSAGFAVSASPGGTVTGAVNGSGLAQAQLVVAQQVLDFGSVVTGGGGQLSVDVLNTGDVPTGMEASTVTGTGYAIASDSCQNHAIVAGGTCTVVVAFAPTSVGTVSGQLALAATPGGPAVAILTGIAIAPNALVMSPSASQYASTIVGQTTTRTFTVSNQAAVASGTLNSVLDGATPGQFTIGTDTCQGNSLAPAGQCTVDVSFAPTVGGPAAATLAVSSQQLGTVTAALAGVGLAAPTLAIAPAAKDFGSVPMGTQSATQTFAITNVGGQLSGVPTAALGGTDAAQFAVVATDCNASLAPQASCTAVIRFAPTAIGAASATLSVSATPGSTVVANLAGAGIAADGLAITPSTLSFPITSVGDSATAQTATVTNLGTTTTGALVVTTSGANSGDFAATNTCTTLAAGQACTIAVTFTPTAIGPRTATVTVTGAPGGTATLALAGTARPRLEIIALNAAPPTDPYDFGSRIASFGSADVVITLRNNTATAKPLALVETYGTPPQFATLDNACGATIAPASPCAVRVRFAPTAVGPQTGSTAFSIGSGANDQTTQHYTGAGSSLTDKAPTDLALAPATIAENKPVGTVIGQLTSNDPDPNDTFTYALVTGAGSTDNALFSISGATVVAAASFDFEAQPTRSIRVRTTDSGFKTFEKQLTVTITDANDAPTALALAPSSIAENQPIGATIGAFTTTDQDAGDTFTYALVAGAGATDNAQFAISGPSLVSAASFDFETKASYAIRVRTTDAAGATFERALTVVITNANDPPTAIALVPATIAENQPAGTTVGTFATTDPDANDTFTYALVPGAGSADNGAFAVSGGVLKTAQLLDFEVQSSFQIRVRVTDSGGLQTEQALTIAVTNVDDAPSALVLTNNTIPENSPLHTTIGTLVATDEDAGDTATYTLVSGAGSTDNASFEISGSTLKAAASFDFETQSMYSIRVRATDSGGLFIESQLAIIVTDVAEGTSDIALSSNQIPENSGANAIVATITATSPNPGATFTYALVAGMGATDNALFNIAGDKLQENASFDFESAAHGPTYAIRIQSTDSLGVMFEKALAISVTDVDEAATVTTTLSTLAYTENATVAVDPGVTVTDPDGAATAFGAITSASVAITGNCKPGEDVLALAPALVPMGMTASYNANALPIGCLLSLTLNAGMAPVSTAAIQAALQAVTYTNSSDDPDAVDARTVTFTVTDGGNLVNAPGAPPIDTRDISVTAVNDAPIVTIASAPITFTEGGTGTAVSLAAAPTGATESGTTATFTTTAPHGLAVGNAVLVQGVALAGYNGRWIVTAATATTFTATLPAGLTASGAGTATGLAAPLVIDATALVVDPDSQIVDATIAIGAAGCTPGEDVLDATLGAATGSITKAYASATCTLTLTGPGTPAQFQAAFAAATYLDTNTDNPSTATRTVTFTADDGALTGSGARDITVVAVNDAPVNALPASPTIDQNTVLALSSSGAGAISVSDVDAAGAMETVALVASTGTLHVSSGSSMGNDTPNLTLTGTIADLNTALDGMTFTPDPAFFGQATIQVTTNDNGHTGTGGAQQDVDTLVVTVNHHVPPSITSAASVTFTTGVFGTFTVTTKGFPINAISEAGALPAGVSFVDNGDDTATLSGTPGATAGGSYPLALTAHNTITPDGTQNFVLTVDQAPKITSANSVTFVVGAANTFKVTTTGFPTNASMAITETGALPDGALTGGASPVTFVNNNDGTATFSGTPGMKPVGTYPLTFPLTITADNGVPMAATQTFTFTAQCPAIAVSGSAPPLQTYMVGMTSQSFTNTGGNGGITWSATGLPGGIVLNPSTGVLAGTPMATGTFTPTITATDFYGCTGSLSLGSFNVQPNLSPDVGYATVGNTQLFISGGTITAPTTPTVTNTTTLLANDLSDSGIAITNVVPTKGSITVDAGGHFLYTPNAGATGTDTFTYSGTSNGVTATATISIAISNMVWYVDNTNAGTADGRSSTPFAAMSAITGTSAGDIIYVSKGGGAVTPTPGAYAMLANQQLIGAGADLNVPAVSPILTVTGAGGKTPTIGGTLTLAAGVAVSGVDFSTGASDAIDGDATVASATLTLRNVATTSGTAIKLVGSTADFLGGNLSITSTSGTGFSATAGGTVTVQTNGNKISTAMGTALNLANMTIGGANIKFTSVSNSGAANGIVLDTVGGGTLTVVGGTIANATTRGASINAVSAAVSIGAAISDAATGRAVEVTNCTTGGKTIAFSGAISEVGLGINLATNNTSGNATIAFSGGLAINVTGTNEGFKAVQTKTLNITGTNTIDTVNGFGLDLSSNTNAGVPGITFAHVASTGARAINITASGGAGQGTKLFELVSTTTTDTAVLLDTAGPVTIGKTGQLTRSSLTSSANALSITATPLTLLGQGLQVTGTGTGTGVVIGVSSGGASSITVDPMASDGLDITTASGTGFSNLSSGGTTISVVGAHSSIMTTAGTALNLTTTTLAAAGVTFESISAQGGTSGIILFSTSGTGGLTVTGDPGGVNNASGGTLQNITGSAIALTSTSNVSLDQMKIKNTSGSGINGTGVVGFALTNSTIDTVGTANLDSAIAFNTVSFVGAQSGKGNNLNGSLIVVGNTITNPFFSGLDIEADQGTIATANVSNNVFTGGANGINIVGGGKANVTFGITTATVNQNAISNVGAGIQISATNNVAGPASTIGAAGQKVSITNNAIAVTAAGTQAIGVAVTGANTTARSVANLEISCNGSNANGCSAPSATPLNSSSAATVIQVLDNGFTDMTGTVLNNAIVAVHTPNLGARNGILVGTGAGTAGTAATPVLTLTVTGNSVQATDGNGILVYARGATGTANVKVTNNTVGAPVSTLLANEGIRIDAGNNGGSGSLDDAVCATIAGNTSTGGNGALGIAIRKQGNVQATNDFGITGLAPSPATGVQAAAFVTGQNATGGGTTSLAGSNYQVCNTAPP